MDRIKVIIADDMEGIAMQTKSALIKRSDVEVLGIAKDGEEEINMINEFKPDLVFTDNQMPKKNGIDVIEYVYNSDMEKRPRFVLVTGDRDMALYNRANNCEVVRILNKPFGEEQIIDALECYIDNPKYEEKQEVVEEVTEEKKEEKVSFFEKIKNLFNS